MSDFNPGPGWRELDIDEFLTVDIGPVLTLARFEGPVKRWVREAPVPPLPTAPYTVIRPVWLGDSGAVNALMLTANNEWMLTGDDLSWLPDDLPGLISSFEVLSEPRAVTAKAILDRVRHEYDDDDAVLRLIAREFGAES